MSMVHRLLEWEEGGLHQAKKLAAASSGGTSKAGAGLDKLTLPPSATDTVPKWNEGNANSSANRPRSVGLSRSKSKVREGAFYAADYCTFWKPYRQSWLIARKGTAVWNRVLLSRPCTMVHEDHL